MIKKQKTIINFLKKNGADATYGQFREANGDKYTSSWNFQKHRTVFRKNLAAEMLDKQTKTNNKNGARTAREYVGEFYSDGNYSKTWRDFVNKYGIIMSDPSFYQARKFMFPNIQFAKTASDAQQRKPYTKKVIRTYDILFELSIDDINDKTMDILNELIERLSTSLGLKISTETLINPTRIEVRRYVK